MDRRVRHRIERLKKLNSPQKADVFFISVDTEDTTDDSPVGESKAEENEMFTIHQSIEVKKAE